MSTPSLATSVPQTSFFTGSGAAIQGNRAHLWKLSMASIGVVYGDIGTSPLYAVKESVKAAAGEAAPSAEVVLGIISLILWALTIIVTVKYVLLMLRADNNGEGGTLSLMALVQRVLGHKLLFVPVLGILGAALFYGDAMITPALSVLSAVEGLQLVTPALSRFVLPLSTIILVALFAFQSRGTAGVAVWFSPVVIIWFVILAVGGLLHIAQNPQVLAAINPLHGVAFIANHGTIGFITLGAVFLAVTGAEALYADLGHFGRPAISWAWLGFVFPSLAINYMGQGALLLSDPAAIENPFFRLYPPWALLPMIALATAATIIASQAVITGTYSVTQQAMQLGLLPRFEIRRTSETEKGQIYVPAINWMLMVTVLYLVGMFETSSALATAYGIAVTGTMVVTAILAFFVVWRCWNWSWWAAALLITPFLAVDLVFLTANLFKVMEGGWLPISVGAALVLVMLTWRRGTRLLARKTQRDEVPLAKFARSLEKRGPARIRATAVFLTSNPDNVPTALLHNLKHNKILHGRNIILSVETADVPRVPAQERARMAKVSDTFTTVALRFGFMEEPDVPGALLQACREAGVTLDMAETSFYLSRRALRPGARSAMPQWQDRLFIWLTRRATDASAYFKIPTDRAVEVGTQVVI